MRASFRISMLLTILIATPAAAQNPEPRRYLPNRADEDWSFLEHTPPADLWDPVKYIPLRGADSFMTLSGEVRYRGEGFRIRDTSTRPGAIDNYLLQRYLFGADVHVGRRARFFGELQSGIINGSLRSPRPTDRNSLDVHQAFVEWRQPIRTASISIKAGRQELSIGSTRLISASPGLNVKRSFNGVATVFRAPTWTVAGAAAQLVRLGSGIFDDRTDSDQLFWGVAASRRSPRFERGELGAYYLGIERTASQYAQGIGAERRHTAGVKWVGSGARFDLNYDGLFQWGEFGNGGPIRAWAFATETGWALPIAGWRTRLFARADVASGDRDAADPRLQAFNPLFPGNAYSGAVGLLGPTNLTDFTAGVTLAPRTDLTIGFEVPSYWRTSTEDGVYGTDLRMLVAPAAGEGKYVGTNPGVLVVWQATRHCQLQAVATRFLSGRFLQDSFVSSGFGFYSVSAVYRF
jgi:hypothetical protein